MTILEMAEKIRNHNNKIDFFINKQLPQILGVEDGKITARDWFRAQELIRQQGFYKQGMEILEAARAAGHDVKISGQTNKLEYYGEIR